MIKNVNKYIIIFLIILNILLISYILIIRKHFFININDELKDNQMELFNNRLFEKLMKDLILENLDFYYLLNHYLQKTDSLDLSKIDTVNFETKDDCYFLHVTPFEVTAEDGYIIGSAFPAKFIAHFSKDGKLIKKFGREGQGPGEYISPYFVDIKDDTIFCYDNAIMKMLTYSLSGEFLSEYKLSSGELFPKDFKISPIDNKAIFYHIYSPFQNNILSIYELLTSKNYMKILTKSGNMKKINIPSSIIAIRGLAVSENGYIFTISPQEFGFDVFSSDGMQIASFRHKAPHWFKKLKQIDNKYLFDQKKLTNLFFRHSRCLYIHYLSKGVIGIYVQNPMKKSDKQIPSYYTFWRVDGKYLGALKTSEEIIKGKNGTLYFWLEKSDEWKDDYNYENPLLLKIRLWDSNS